MSGDPRDVSASLVPGSISSSWTSVGAAPERVTSSTSTPWLGPVHSGDVAPRSSGSAPASAFGSASSVPTSVHSPHRPSASCTRTWTTVSVTAGSWAQLRPTIENSSTPVRETVSVGAVSATPATGSVVPSCTSAAGAGSSVDPSGTSSEVTSTGTASGPGSA